MTINDKVSVLVAIYNPKIEQTLETLQSVIRQKDIPIQIVITDDGSKNNCFPEIEEYLKKQGITDYKFVASEQNRGTVKNAIQGLNVCDGEYIKLISPGDCLTESTILKNWVKHLKDSKKEWSFGNAVYYKKNEHRQKVPIVELAHPVMVNVYEKKEEEKCIWNYLALNDIVLGAATLCRKRILERYLARIEGKVIYAEDHIYRIMMFDRIVGDYFPGDVVLYEYGEGVSTSGSELWKERLIKDWQAADKIMLEGRKENDPLQSKIIGVYQRSYDHGSRLKYFLGRLTEKGRLKMVVARWVRLRTTSSKTDME